VWIRCAIDATILYVSIGAQPVPCSLTQSGIAYVFRGKEPGVVRHAREARTSISAGGARETTPVVDCSLAQHNIPSSKFSTYPMRQPVRVVALDEIHGNFLCSVDTIDVVSVDDRAEDFRSR
jgi:hypothetical protein